MESVGAISLEFLKESVKIREGRVSTQISSGESEILFKLVWEPSRHKLASWSIQPLCSIRRELVASDG